MTGLTQSASFGSITTTPGAAQTAFSGKDMYANNAFAQKYDASGTVVYSTFLGGGATASDSGAAIAVDASGNAYVTGVSTAAGFPTTSGAVQTASPGGNDAFALKLNPAGTSVLYATLLGGTASDRGEGIAVDGAGHAYVTGAATAGFPITSDAAQPGFGGNFSDAFLTELAADGKSIYSTYLGGSGMSLTQPPRLFQPLHGPACGAVCQLLDSALSPPMPKTSSRPSLFCVTVTLTASRRGCSSRSMVRRAALSASCCTPHDRSRCRRSEPAIGIQFTRKRLEHDATEFVGLAPGSCMRAGLPHVEDITVRAPQKDLQPAVTVDFRRGRRCRDPRVVVDVHLAAGIAVADHPRALADVTRRSPQSGQGRMACGILQINAVERGEVGIGQSEARCTPYASSVSIFQVSSSTLLIGRLELAIPVNWQL